MSNNFGFSSLSGKVIRKDYDKALRQIIMNKPSLTNQEKRAVLNKLHVPPPPPPKKGGRRSKRRTSKKQQKMSKKKRKYNKKTMKRFNKK